MRRSPPPPAASPTRWTPEQVAGIVARPATTIPAIAGTGGEPLLAGLDLWDLWPLQLADGATAQFDGWSVWFILSAPRLPDPEARHDVARIRLVTERHGAWRDCGDALPDGLNPGSREWAGSALYEPGDDAVTLFYTVAGRRGEARASFAQRLFRTRGRIAVAGGDARIADWSIPAEAVVADGADYVVVDQFSGRPGFIKGFRDPAHFRDPADSATYLLFTGSFARAASEWNGCIGLARATDAGLESWSLRPPLVDASGVSNEQERPHVIVRAGRYYLFWSTQRKVFAPDGPNGPNGLYGMVADALAGPWRPLNGTGLVAANPEDALYQTYSWWVDADLTVHGFVDYPQVPAGGAADDPAWRRARFGGVPAPRFRIALDGDRAWIDR